MTEEQVEYVAASVKEIVWSARKAQSVAVGGAPEERRSL
jgi:hypothetical protein